MPTTTWSETVASDEAERHERQAELLGRLQTLKAEGNSPGRALHRKATGGVAGRFEVLADLPEPARVGLFATPGTFEARVRFSNGSASHQSDRRPDVRGIAIKLLGVEGRKILPGLETATTQDFLLIQSPATPFLDSAEFVTLVWAMRNPLLALPRLLWGLGVGRTLGLVKRLQSNLARPTPSLAAQAYWSALPIRFGTHAVRYALVPDLKLDGDAGASTPEDLRDELAQRLQRDDVAWTFSVQFYEDDRATPIEDASAVWAVDDAPLVPVGRLVLPRQDLDGEDARATAAAIERMSFDPWHATEDFRPLGEMMRARRAAYKVSAIGRKAELEPGV